VVVVVVVVEEVVVMMMMMMIVLNPTVGLYQHDTQLTAFTKCGVFLDSLRNY
jgi:hypothetical protein